MMKAMAWQHTLPVLWLLLLLAICLPDGLYALDAPYATIQMDSLKARPDSVHMPLTLNQPVKIRYQIPLIELDFHLWKYNMDMWEEDWSPITADLWDISRELYENYYMRKVTLLNISDRIYLYMSLKDAQTKKGGLQVTIPLGSNKSNLTEIKTQGKE